MAAEKDLRTSLERNCTSLWVDIENARKATVDLRDKLEASRVAFNKKSCRVDELTADLAKHDHLHAATLESKAKEAARSSEHREKLDVDCNKMQSQLLVVEE